MKCSSKKFQYVLALISTILFIKHWLKISTLEEIFPSEQNLLFVIIMYIIFSPLFIWVPIIWNRWLYENMFEDESNPPISYEGFQCIATVVLFILTMYFIIRTFFIPIV